MIHLGDITKINGAEIEPVWCITGGSPCQDLSIAGKRAGLAGARSGLFMEQVRIVKEMREADKRNGRTGDMVRPRYLVWEIVGVAIVGRPVSRHLDDGWTLEVNRLCTDGTHNACSMLYAAAWRAARAMGYKRLVTYILDSESGTSLKASGWKCVGQAGGLRWTGKRRPEVDLYPAQMKIRWEKDEHDGSVD